VTNENIVIAIATLHFLKFVELVINKKVKKATYLFFFFWLQKGDISYMVGYYLKHWKMRSTIIFRGVTNVVKVVVDIKTLS